ncbi:MAG: hypothetical protein UT05_C0007G0026 [Parcubacteria group bacterium GW2011_GWF2_38_76]|nr:MAG: hypothetical protein UT05_C0007G0026 [Parcubacteria group bacterium GW2011_GWF2_38_76]
MAKIKELYEEILELNLNIIVLKHYFSTIDPDGSELTVARERISKLKEKIREIRGKKND